MTAAGVARHGRIDVCAERDEPRRNGAVRNGMSQAITSTCSVGASISAV